MMTELDRLNDCWGNCGALDDETLLGDEEIVAIDELEESLKPLDDFATEIRWLISSFSSCYHEADVEAERIIKAIGSGVRPEEEKDPPVSE